MMPTPIDLSHFYENNDSHQPLKSRPVYRTWDDVFRCIQLQAGNNSDIVDAFIAEAIATEAWDYFDRASRYNEQLKTTVNDNTNLSIIGDSDNGEPVFAPPKPLPIPPTPPTTTTLADWKTRHYSLLRRAAYDSVGDQLDRITKTLKYLHDQDIDIGPEGEAQLITVFGEAGVKTRHPKPNEGNHTDDD